MHTSPAEVPRGAEELAWLAAMKNLEFMYVFDADGTMTESSNYDSFPPGPPAYGQTGTESCWRT